MATMRVLVVLVLLMVFITVTRQGLPSASASCCTQLAKRIPKNMLQQVTEVRLQKKDGICSLRAIVLHVENHLKCMDPKNRFLQHWVKKHHPSKYQG
ncbi:C-C motif chemokine 27 [Rhinoderma darwinii]|uniref:C-C motif chemokine 27 n=1 Tax=Rhinoderma darwinii TaxID=43563 RepID=UPI003F67B832